eukprot:GEMP01095590.1.p1 GENE.GEMP01095590.1~~GEMP01095590.1.p1  ORF type:complete len:155 (-),score=10.01 GEMP01095590.1:51-515(-)
MRHGSYLARLARHRSPTFFQPSGKHIFILPSARNTLLLPFSARRTRALVVVIAGLAKHVYFTIGSACGTCIFTMVSTRNTYLHVSSAQIHVSAIHVSSPFQRANHGHCINTFQVCGPSTSTLRAVSGNKHFRISISRERVLTLIHACGYTYLLI